MSGCQVKFHFYHELISMDIRICKKLICMIFLQDEISDEHITIDLFSFPFVEV